MNDLIQYPTFILPHWFEGPDDLVQLLRDIWNCRFPELYDRDEENREICSLDQSLNRILDKLWENGGAIGHKRFVFCGLATALATKPTMARWNPNDPRTKIVLDRVENWLQDSTNREPATLSNVFPQEYTGSQAYDEAIDVFLNLTRILDTLQARTALLEILDDCLEGFAVFPGSARRRDLFNWFLIEVVPAAWCLRLPETIYTW